MIESIMGLLMGNPYITAVVGVVTVLLFGQGRSALQKRKTRKEFEVIQETTAEVRDTRDAAVEEKNKSIKEAEDGKIDINLINNPDSK